MMNQSLTTTQVTFVQFLQLIKLENKTKDSAFNRLPRNANYMSKDSQNEILSAVNEIITDKIIAEVKAAGQFSVIADDIRDVSDIEQMSICMRYVTTSFCSGTFL